MRKEKKIEDWEKEFDKEIYYKGTPIIDDWAERIIKFFISNLLTQARQETIDSVVEVLKDMKDIKEELSAKYDIPATNEAKSIFHIALSEAIEKIKSLKQKR